MCVGELGCLGSPFCRGRKDGWFPLRPITSKRWCILSLQMGMWENGFTETSQDAAWFFISSFLIYNFCFFFTGWTNKLLLMCCCGSLYKKMVPLEHMFLFLSFALALAIAFNIKQSSWKSGGGKDTIWKGTCSRTNVKTTRSVQFIFFEVIGKKKKHQRVFTLLSDICLSYRIQNLSNEGVKEERSIFLSTCETAQIYINRQTICTVNVCSEGGGWVRALR